MRAATASDDDDLGVVRSSQRGQERLQRAPRAQHVHVHDLADIGDVRSQNGLIPRREYGGVRDQQPQPALVERPRDSSERTRIGHVSAPHDHPRCAGERTLRGTHVPHNGRHGPTLSREQKCGLEADASPGSRHDCCTFLQM